MKTTKVPAAHRTVAVEEIPPGNHWEPATYDVYWRNPNGTTTFIGTAATDDDATAFAAELLKLELTRPL